MRRAVLSLPSKPWKKVKVEALGGPRLRIVLLTDLPDEAAFLKVIDEDLRLCLGAGDALEPPDWPSRSVVLETRDLPGLKRNLVVASVMITTAKQTDTLAEDSCPCKPMR